MNKIKLFLLFIITGILIGTYILLSLDAYSVNIGDTYYVIPADVMALLIFLFNIIIATVYFVFKRYINFHLGFLNFFLLTIPIVYMCSFNGIGEAVSLYNTTIWTAEYFRNVMIILFLIGNILFFTILTTSIFKFIKEKIEL